MEYKEITNEIRRERIAIAAHALQGLLASRSFANDTKKRVVDNAIAYADMMLRRLGEIPCNAQQMAEAGMRLKNSAGSPVDWDEINRIADKL